MPHVWEQQLVSIGEWRVQSLRSSLLSRLWDDILRRVTEVIEGFGGRGIREGVLANRILERMVMHLLCFTCGLCLWVLLVDLACGFCVWICMWILRCGFAWGFCLENLLGVLFLNLASRLFLIIWRRWCSCQVMVFVCVNINDKTSLALITHFSRVYLKKNLCSHGVCSNYHHHHQHNLTNSKH